MNNDHFWSDSLVVGTRQSHSKSLPPPPPLQDEETLESSVYGSICISWWKQEGVGGRRGVWVSLCVRVGLNSSDYICRMSWRYVPVRGIPERFPLNDGSLERWVPWTMGPFDNVFLLRSVPDDVYRLWNAYRVDNHNSYSQKLGFPRVHWGHWEKPKLRSSDPALEPHHKLPAHGTELINLCRNNVRSDLCKEWIVSGYIVQGTHCTRKKFGDGLTLNT